MFLQTQIGATTVAMTIMRMTAQDGAVDLRSEVAS